MPRRRSLVLPITRIQDGDCVTIGNRDDPPVERLCVDDTDKEREKEKQGAENGQERPRGSGVCRLLAIVRGNGRQGQSLRRSGLRQ